MSFAKAASHRRPPKPWAGKGSGFALGKQSGSSARNNLEGILARSKAAQIELFEIIFLGGICGADEAFEPSSLAVLSVYFLLGLLTITERRSSLRRDTSWQRSCYLSFISCGYPSEFFDLCEVVFDQMAPLVHVSIVISLHFTV